MDGERQGGTLPGEGVDPLHRYKPHKHWVELRSNPLQKLLQTVTLVFVNLEAMRSVN